MHDPGSDRADCTTPDAGRLEAIAVDAGAQAARLVRRAHGKALVIGTKSSQTDAVTQTDVDTEALIRALLAKATPGAGVRGEEGGAEGVTERLQWIVDPLDGTVNFLYGLPVCSVSIAAAFDGRFVAGPAPHRSGPHHRLVPALEAPRRRR